MEDCNQLNAPTQPPLKPSIPASDRFDQTLELSEYVKQILTGETPEQKSIRTLIKRTENKIKDYTDRILNRPEILSNPQALQQAQEIVRDLQEKKAQLEKALSELDQN